MKELRVYGGGAVLDSTSASDGRRGQKAPEGTARLACEVLAESMSRSESVSDDEEAGDNSGVAVGVDCQNKRGGKVFLSMADAPNCSTRNSRSGTVLAPFP